MLKSIRKMVAISGCAALALGSVMAAPASAVTLPESAADGVPTDIEDLGVSAFSNNVRFAEAAVLSDGTPVGYLFNDGEPVSFNMVDLRTGEVLDRYVFEEYSVAASIVINPDDDMVYLSVRSPNDGTMWSYDPHAKQMEKVASRIVDEDMLRSLVFYEGMIYGSTYPGAKVYSLNPETGDIHDYGTVDEESSYAWGFAEVNGNLWVGTGTNPTLNEVNIETGEITRLDLPQEVTDNTDFITALTRHDDLVVMQYGSSMIYDLTADDWCCEDQDTITHLTQDSLDGKFYYRTEAGVKGFDIASRTSFSIGLESADMLDEFNVAGTRSLHLIEMGLPEYPGTSLVGMRDDGEYWIYNLEEQRGEVIRSEIVGSPATVHSVGIAPDGNAYFGMYLSSGVMGKVNHPSGELESVPGHKQADAIITIGEHVVIGTYPGAGFHSGEVADSLDWGEMSDPLFTIGRRNGQDRVSDLIDAGGLAAAATIPNYGELGGALVLFDPAGDGSDAQVHRNIIQDHSVVSLEYRDGLIYAGTSIHGGIDSTPTEGPAQIFVWDVEEQTLVASVPVEGSEIVHSMEFDSAGNLWAMADNGDMLRFDTETNAVAETIATGVANSNVWGRVSELNLNPVNGLIYGNAASTMFVFHPETGEVETFGPADVRYSIVMDDGTVYFGDTTNIYRFTVEGVEDPTDPGDDDQGDDGDDQGDDDDQGGDHPRPGLPKTGA